jgi:hypothetical protein
MLRNPRQLSFRKIRSLGGLIFASATYDPRGRRTQDAFVTGEKWYCGYDLKPGDPTSPTELGADSGYAFDEIGKRSSASASGRMSTCTANGFNEYSARTMPGGYDVGDTDARLVYVKGVKATLPGTRFASSQTAGNSAGALGAAVSVNGYKPGTPVDHVETLSATGAASHVFVPKASEAPHQRSLGTMTTAISYEQNYK